MAQINPVRYRYTGNGTNKQFAVPFDYIEPADVQVSVDGVPTAGTLSPGLVILGIAPANGAVVEVYRSTDATTPMHVFQHGSPLLPKPLDDNFRQVLYSVEEGVATADDALDLAATAISTADTAYDAAESASITANQALANSLTSLNEAGTATQTAQAAVQVAQGAASTAFDANLAASTAVQTAGTAASNASTALSTANTALSTAGSADSKADSAISTAGVADAKAGQAIQDSQSALSTAGSADTKADSALSASGTASSDASAALAAAGSAVNSADSAVLTADAAYATAQGIDAKASQALLDSADAVQRVEDVEDIIGDLQSGGVTSFNGRVGAIAPVEGDYTYDQITGLQEQLDAKLGPESLTSNLTVYLTRAPADVSGYLTTVDDTHDPLFPATVETADTDQITNSTAEGQALRAWITRPADVYFHADSIPVNMIGAVRLVSTAGAKAQLSFKILVRKPDGSTTEVASSGWSSVINRAEFSDLHQAASIPHLELQVGDRLVIAWYGRKVDTGVGAQVRVRYGGSDPVRMLMPLPFTAVLPELGDAAKMDVGTTAGTVAAGDDPRILGALQATSLEQTAGNSTSAVMSQKATTDAINAASQNFEGQELPSNDLDNVTQPGVYTAPRGNTVSNSPTTSVRGFNLLVLGSSNGTTQLYYAGDSPNGETPAYRRTHNTYEWSKWISENIYVEYSASAKLSTKAAGYGGAAPFTLTPSTVLYTAVDNSTGAIQELPVSNNVTGLFLGEVKRFNPSRLAGDARSNTGFIQELTVLNDMPNGGPLAGTVYRRGLVNWNMNNGETTPWTVLGAIPPSLKEPWGENIPTQTWITHTGMRNLGVSLTVDIAAGLGQIQVRRDPSTPPVIISTCEAGDSVPYASCFGIVPPGYQWRSAGGHLSITLTNF